MNIIRGIDVSFANVEEFLGPGPNYWHTRLPEMGWDASLVPVASSSTLPGPLRRTDGPAFSSQGFTIVRELTEVFTSVIL